jgi:hypothetical protein
MHERETMGRTHVLGSVSSSLNLLYESPLNGRHEISPKVTSYDLTKQLRFPGSFVHASANLQSRAVGTL